LLPSCQSSIKPPSPKSISVSCQQLLLPFQNNWEN
jgi:hypothetical protein